VSGSASAEYYLSTVVDDETPRSLQPYLQRRAGISLGASGGIEGTGETATAGASTTRLANASAEILGYPTESLYLAAGAGLGYAVSDQQTTTVDPESANVGVSTTHSLSPAGSGTIGYRTGDTLLTMHIYHATTRYQGQWSGSGSVTFGARTVLSQTLDLDASLYLQQHNVIPSINGTYYFTQDLGVSGGALWQHLTVSPLQSDYVRGSVGLSYWVSSTFGLSATYGIGGDHRGDGSRGWVQTLSVEVWTRS
jgi:hypothetical protein